MRWRERFSDFFKPEAGPPRELAATSQQPADP